MNLDPAIVRQVQLRVGAEPDGILGPVTLAAIAHTLEVTGEFFQRLGIREDPVPAEPPAGLQNAASNEAAKSKPEFHQVIASSFADPADIAAFRRCKAAGKTDRECFQVGDNGIGCWGDDCTDATPRCALPPDDMLARWGTIAAARHKPVLIRCRAREVRAILSDRMPWKKNIRNGAGLDMNPALCAALGLRPPVMVRASWAWA